MTEFQFKEYGELINISFNTNNNWYKYWFIVQQ